MTHIFHRSISPSASQLDYRCMRAVSQQIWCFENAGQTKRALFVLRAATEKFKTSDFYHKVKFIDECYHHVTLSTSHIVQIRRMIRKT